MMCPWSITPHHSFGSSENYLSFSKFCLGKYIWYISIKKNQKYFCGAWNLNLMPNSRLVSALSSALCGFTLLSVSSQSMHHWIHRYFWPETWRWIKVAFSDIVSNVDATRRGISSVLCHIASHEVMQCLSQISRRTRLLICLSKGKAANCLTSQSDSRGQLIVPAVTEFKQSVVCLRTQCNILSLKFRHINYYHHPIQLYVA